MKNFYKILIAFLLVFSIGFLVTYISINAAFKNISEQEVSSLPHSTILNKTNKIISITF